MEWKKSTLSGAELERKRKEYIEAAMKMSDRAQPASEEENALKKEAEEIVFAQPQTPPSAEPAPKEEAEEPPQAPPSEAPAPKEKAEEPPQTPPSEAPAPKEETETPDVLFQPELLHEPEPIEEAEKKFGVFDVDELIEAVKKGEIDGERLREASEILEGMSGKTEEMQKLAGQPGEPVSLDQSVRRHNGGSCPRCGQGNRNGNRR